MKTSVLRGYAAETSASNVTLIFTVPESQNKSPEKAHQPR